MIDKRHRAFLDEIKAAFENRENDTSDANSRVLIVDGLNTFIRCFAAVPVVNDDGLHIGGISGFLRSLGYAIEITQPTRVVIVFDGKGGSVRRKKLYPEYKERRNPSVRLNRTAVFADKSHESEMLGRELFRTLDYLNCLPVTVLALDNVEADDVMAYIAMSVLPQSHIFIMSADKDFLQLCSDRVEVWSPTKKKIYTPELVKTEYKVAPINFTLVRAISGKGDKSDNIGGIKGFGTSTIVKKFPMLTEERKVELDEVCKHALSFINKPKQKDKMYERFYAGREIVERNCKLMQLGNVDISASAKSKVLEIVRNPIHSMNKYQIMKMFIEDKLYNGIPNMELWLREHWTTIERYAQLSQKKGSK